MEEATQNVEPNKISNQIYILAKEITQTKNEEEKLKLFENLGSLVQNIFKNKNEEEIEQALQIAADKEEHEVMSVIMDDTEIEIENISFDREGVSYNSSMLLLSCTMMTNEKIIEMPSILKFQTVIQKHLLKTNIITRADQFKLGAVKIDQETIEELSMQEWWNIHHNIVGDLGTPENDEKMAYQQKIEVESGLNMFHLVLILIMNETDEEFLKELLDSSKYEGMWADISKEMSTQKIGFNFLTPDFISKGMLDAKYIFQSAKLHLVINEYQEYDNIEMGYIKLENDDNPNPMYVVFFFDNEDYSLADFFIFDAEDNESEFVTMLVNEVSEFPTQKLWHFDHYLSAETLDSWYEDDEDSPVDLSELIATGYAVDLNHFFAATHGSSQKHLH